MGNRFSHWAKQSYVPKLTKKTQTTYLSAAARLNESEQNISLTSGATRDAIYQRKAALARSVYTRLDARRDRPRVSFAASRSELIAIPPAPICISSSLSLSSPERISVPEVTFDDLDLVRNIGLLTEETECTLQSFAGVLAVVVCLVLCLSR